MRLRFKEEGILTVSLKSFNIKKNKKKKMCRKEVFNSTRFFPCTLWYKNKRGINFSWMFSYLILARWCVFSGAFFGCKNCTRFQWRGLYKKKWGFEKWKRGVSLWRSVKKKRGNRSTCEHLASSASTSHAVDGIYHFGKPDSQLLALAAVSFWKLSTVGERLANIYLTSLDVRGKKWITDFLFFVHVSMSVEN